MLNQPRKSVFITGVSSGFGYLIAKQLLQKDYFVVAAIRGGEKRAKEIFCEYHQKIDNKSFILIDTDISDEENLKKSLTYVVDIFSEGLDILINNAGFGLLGPIELQEESQIRLQFETNFFAPLLIIQKVLPLLRKKQGRILNMSSMVGFTVFPFYGIYAASKHSLDILTEALYYELLDFKIQVCAIEPGGFKTKFNSNFKFLTKDCIENSIYQSRLKKFYLFLDYVQKKIEKDPCEVANLVINLCEKKTIPIRIRVGIDAHLNWFIKKIIPDFWRVKIQHWLYKKYFF